MDFFLSDFLGDLKFVFGIALRAAVLAGGRRVGAWSPAALESTDFGAWGVFSKSNSFKRASRLDLVRRSGGWDSGRRSPSSSGEVYEVERRWSEGWEEDWLVRWSSGSSLRPDVNVLEFRGVGREACGLRHSLTDPGFVDMVFSSCTPQADRPVVTNGVPGVVSAVRVVDDLRLVGWRVLAVSGW